MVEAVDGLMVCTSGLADEELLPLLKHHAAVVAFDRTIDQAVGCSVRVDDIYGGIVGTSHLIQNGRRRLALLAGPPHYYSGGDQRRYGFRLALETAGIKPKSVPDIACEPDEAGGFAAAHTLLPGNRKIDGIFCFKDLVALGALRACGEQGVRAPDDIALVGFDDIRLASLTTPPLTTLRVDKQQLGRVMVELVFEQIEKRASTSREVLLRPELMARESAPLVNVSASQRIQAVISSGKGQNGPKVELNRNAN